ncbi:MAG: PAS domain S-box protein [Bacteroidales bacterium]
MKTAIKMKSGEKKESVIRLHKKCPSVNKKDIINIPEINKSFFENSLDAMMIGSQDGQIYSANPAACRMLGYSEKEICKLGRKGIVDQTPKLVEAIKKRKESYNFSGELTLIKKNGMSFPVELSSSVFSTSDEREFTTLIIRDITERKKTEQALLESKTLINSIIDSTTDLIWSVDPDQFRLLTFNKSLDEFFKKEGIQIRKGMLLEEILPTQLVKKLYNLYSQTLNKGSLITEYQTSIGNRTLWINLNLLSRESKPYAISVFAQDITERKTIEERIKTSEAEYRSLFENSIMGISQTLPDGKIIRINKAYAEMYGYPDAFTMLKENSSGVKMLYSDPQDRKRVLNILAESGFMPPTEFELNRRNGEKFWALVGAKEVKDNMGKLLYIQAEHIDISSRKKLEKELYSSSHYARSLIEASLDPLVTINIDGKITDVNIATEQITGIKRRKLIGTDFADYFEYPAKARTGYKTVFSEGMIKDYPLTILHTSGRKKKVLYNATVFKNEKGEIQGILAAARDITDQKKMEAELRESHELLEKLNQYLVNAIEEERNQIALNLHDDLGQKLTAINLDIAWLKSRIGVQSKTVREKFGEISSLIKETIESTKKTSAFLRPAMLFDLGLVPAIESQLVNFEKQTAIKCKFYYRPEKIILEDRISLILYRIFQESMTNIARHSGASTADVNLHVHKNKVELIINDDGTGIEKNKVNSLKSMGLEGIKERVKSADGKISIVGVHGSGTKITVEIPFLKVKTND